jgi:hypothetical protein
MQQLGCHNRIAVFLFLPHKVFKSSCSPHNAKSLVENHNNKQTFFEKKIDAGLFLWSECKKNTPSKLDVHEVT